MTVRSSLATHLQRLSAAPPWYVRVLGGLIIAADGYVWLGEATPTTTLELVKHGILLLVGLSLFYPEAARSLMGFARKTLPLLDRRSAPRPPKDTD